jgi:hypothetical protein
MLRPQLSRPLRLWILFGTGFSAPIGFGTFNRAHLHGQQKRAMVAREGKGPDELTNKVWALDQRQLLNTKQWLAGEEKK